MAFDKKFLVHGANAAIAVGLCVVSMLCVKQCYDKKDEQQAASSWKKQYESLSSECATKTGKLEEATGKLEEAEGTIANLADLLNGKDEELAAADSTISQLRDSLAIVNQNLDDCKNSKKAKPAAKKNCKPCEQKKANAKKQETAKAPCKPCDEKADVAKSEVKDDALVDVTIGCGAHDNTVDIHDNTVNINNGTVNNYYAPVDTAKTQCTTVTRTIVLKKRVYIR